MTITLYGRATSSNVQAVMWTLAELDLPHTRLDVGGRFGGTDTPEFLALSPMGKVPALVDQDRRLFESGAIVRYLSEQYGLGRIDTSPEADVWAEWAKLTLVRGFIMDVFWAFYRTPEPERDMDAVTGALRNFESFASLAMAQRGAGPLMMGTKLSLADIWVGNVLFRYFTLDGLPRQIPDGLQVYYDALCARPAFRSSMMIDYSELKARISF